MDLRRLHLVALVGTQGRHAGGLGKEFSRSYRLRYSRDGRRWMDWKDRWGQEVRLEGEAPGNVSPLATLQTASVTARAPASPDCLNLAASCLLVCGVLKLILTSPKDLSSHSYPRSVPFSCSQVGKLISPIPMFSSSDHKLRCVGGSLFSDSLCTYLCGVSSPSAPCALPSS